MFKFTPLIVKGYRQKTSSFKEVIFIRTIIKIPVFYLSAQLFNFGFKNRGGLLCMMEGLSVIAFLTLNGTKVKLI